jgi:hypothetical protein
MSGSVIICKVTFGTNCRKEFAKNKKIGVTSRYKK